MSPELSYFSEPGEEVSFSKTKFAVTGLENVQWSRAWAGLPEDAAFISNTHTAAHSNL